MKKVGGLVKFLAIMRTLDPVLKRNVLRELALKNPIFARLAERMQFLFQDLWRLDDKSLQNLLLKIEEEKLLYAWKLAPPRVKERILENMSERRRDDFLANFQKLGRLPIAQVIRCQIAIARVAQDELSKGNLHTHSRNR